jgi:hypothetical protein
MGETLRSPQLLMSIGPPERRFFGGRSGKKA